MEPPARTCHSCSAAVAGRFCAACGERWIPEGGEPAWQVAGAWVGDFFGTDGRVWRTLWATLFRPGVLTVDYLRGRRRPWLRPLQLFILANALYFLLLPFTAFNAYHSPLDRQLTRQLYSEMLVPVVLEHRSGAIAELEARGVRAALAAELVDEDLDRRYDATSSTLSKSALILFVPMTAIGLALAAPRAGPAAWLILAFHLSCFQILGINLLLGGLLFWMRLLPEGALSVLAGLPSEELMALLLATWSGLALRRLDGRPRWLAALSGLGIAVWVTACLVTYRYLLFWGTWWSVT